MRSNTSIEELLYFPSTHWDREWYLPFQSFRIRFVDVFREILTTLETTPAPAFSAFICDGQTVMLEDYLEIMPQDEERVKKLLDSGRLSAGPWYTMPDENLISGESIIANLNMGRESLSELTRDAAILPLGYLCDIFGHVSQMPQILNGFGITTAILGRGTNESSLPSYFIWESPDKSKCLTYKVPESCGYGSFWYEVYSDSRKTKSMEEAAIAYVQKERLRSPLPFVILMDGMDHTPIHMDAVYLADHLKETFSCNVSIGNVSSFFSHVKEYISNQTKEYISNIPVLAGELQAPAQTVEEHNKLISGTLSSRYDIKYANDQVQTLLEKLALPTSALASLYGYSVSPGFEKTAYQYLLKNHAHDSICGCSVDEVHQDMLYRYRQSSQIAREIFEHALTPFLPEDCTKETKNQDEGILLTLFNPLPFELNKVVTADLSFPPGFLKEKYPVIPSEVMNSFLIQDRHNAVIPYQIESVRKNSTARNPREYYGSAADIYTVCFEAAIPAMGKSELYITPSPTPVRYFGSLRIGPLSARNEFLQLDISNGGEVTLTDLRDNRTYSNLLTFVDYGETGDGWNSRSPIPDAVHHSGFSSGVEVTADGPNKCTFCINHLIPLPGHMEYHRQYTRRSDYHELLAVRTSITIAKNSDMLQCRTEVNNNVKDHRFVLSVRSAISSESYYAEEAFSFVERAVGRSRISENWKEEEREEKSFGNIIYRKRSDGSGLAFLSKGGLHEAASRAQADGCIDITLFRSFEKTFLTDGQADGQLQQELTFDYSILPFGSSLSTVEMLQREDAFRVSPFCHTIPAHRDALASLTSISYGFHLAAQSLYISMIRRSQKNPGQILIRLVNYHHFSASDELCSPLPLTEVSVCNLKEDYIEPAEFQDRIIKLHLKPHEIKTLLLTFRAGQKRSSPSEQ